MSSPASYFASLPEKKRDKLLAKLDDKTKAALFYSWKFWARPKQLAPEGSWRVHVWLGGRGSGKTRCGAEWIRAYAEEHPGGLGMIVASTPGEARDVMIEGSSGLLSICPPWDRPSYEPSKLRLSWRNGFECRIRSAHNPEAIRGPEQEVAWVDELAKFGPGGQRAWDNLMFGLRIGDNPQCVVTTTPKRAPLLLDVLSKPNTNEVKMSTYENADNLAEDFLTEILTRYEGTTLGRQEIHAELLDQVEGALWSPKMIESAQLRAPIPETWVRVVVGVDPTGGAVETGIVTAALSDNGLAYVLDDASTIGSPDTWGKAAVEQFVKHRADRILGERNYGGTMVEHVIHTAAEANGVEVAYEDVDATRGKAVRAEPIAALYEQGRVKHVRPFPELESEMMTWVPGESTFSPNRVDACVWALSKLMLEHRGFGAEAW